MKEVRSARTGNINEEGMVFSPSEKMNLEKSSVNYK